MDSVTSESISAYILAGGQSLRFGGNTDQNAKGLQKLNQKPLISYTIERLKSQVKNIHINTHLADFSPLGYPLVADNPKTLYQGPLVGLFASMQHFHHHVIQAENNQEWLLLAPCDSPFLPEDLVFSLTENLQQKQHLAACISYQNALQPTFSIWHKSLLEPLDQAINQHQWGGLKIFFKSLNTAGHVVEYPQQPLNPFLNINNPEELEQAKQIVRQQPS